MAQAGRAASAWKSHIYRATEPDETPSKAPGNYSHPSAQRRSRQRPRRHPQPPGRQLTREPEPADPASPRSSSRLPAAPAPTVRAPPSFRRLAKLQHIHPPPTPLASRALPARLTPAPSGFPERRPRRPPPSGALPPPSGWRWVGARAEGCEPLLLPPPPLWPSDRGWGALRPPGGPPAAVPETWAGGGGRLRRPHRPPGAEPEVAANKCKLLGPPGRLGEDPRSGTRQPPARVGFAAARRGAGAFPPSPGRGAGQMAGALHCPPALRSKLMLRLNPLAITHDHHRGFYLPV
uniref:Uncharacterized protein n=1 Tax=Rangifer tarandus platyrhynchus TaxID=3082113 RepID=A0ACB0F1K6_RANTA|nr:unnamed protein product [Rangifer tarandus platyrhynchus]